MSISEEDLQNIVNPSAIFLENCDDVLEGVCKVDESFFDFSGTFSGHTAMAVMLSK